MLKQYITETPITRPFFDVRPESLLVAFEAEALRHPVFRILAGEALSLFEHIYADMPPYVEEQHLGEGIHEAEIQEILVKEGAPVEEGDPILVVETGKAMVEVPSRYTGTIAEIHVAAGRVAR